MRGYFNRPEANEETIVDGWLRTGDLARFDADGYLYIVDRKKDMVLSGGMNIYSKEVEGVLLTHPAVRDAALVGVPDEIYGEAVAAYLELEPGTTVTDEEIIALCRRHLAGYKKPKYVRVVDELPRNSSGKTLKYRLRESFVRAGYSSIHGGPRR
jgi:long-chain acyl-CoA synthetase